MLKTIKIIIIPLFAINLSACMIDGTNDYSAPYKYSDAPMIYPDSYDAYNQAYDNSHVYSKETSEDSVVVPSSYHVGVGNPTSSKDVDKNWVNSQDPKSYTIEIANDEKASKVAGVLYKAPKSEKSAEVKTNSGSYKGLYGSYPSYEAAQEKLNSLPEDVKANAGIKSWGNVQKDVN